LYQTGGARDWESASHQLRSFSVRRSGRFSGNFDLRCRSFTDLRSLLRRSHLASAAAILSILLFYFLSARSLASAAPQNAAASAPDLSGVRIFQDHGWPELFVDGKPFFVNGAAFDYFGVPQDLWAHSLDRYRELGINTIDLTIPWNWHETADDEFDFDGHTNPRRDLRGLLRLVADRGFKLIVHVEPQMPATWRLAGYPEWLVRAPDYGMTDEQIADGAEPVIAAEFHRDAAAAAGEWLARQDLVRAAQEYFSALAGELAPYDSHKKITINPPDTWGTTEAKDASGPLLFVIVGDGFRDESRYVSAHGAWSESGAANLARYVNSICSELTAGGVDATCVVSRDDLADNGLASLATSFADAMIVQSAVAGVTGQWIFAPPSTRGDIASGADGTLGAQDAEMLELLADTLSRQSNVPAVITAFHTGGYAAPYEDSPAKVAASATIVGTRFLLGRGIGGIEYAPLQDSLTPAGYETVGENRYANRDAAIDMEGERRAQATAIERNGKLVKAWGERLASAHLRADLGIVDIRAEIARAEGGDSGGAQSSAPPTEEENSRRERARRALEQVLRVAELTGRTPAVVNPATQTVEQLLRYPVLLLVAPKTESGADEVLAERAQQALEEYVRRGGKLIVESVAPTLPGLAALWNGSGTVSHIEGGPDATRRTYGDGEAIEWSQDFYSWVEPEESLEQSRARPEAAWATEELERLIDNAGAPAVIRRTDAATINDGLILSELVGVEASGPLDTLSSRCVTRPLCASGLLSATNLNTSHAAEADLEVLAPGGADTAEYHGAMQIHVSVPPGESLLLPLHAPLCSGAKAEEPCSDEIITAGAELLSAEREKDAIELTFYAPMSAKLLLRLKSRPEKVELDDNSVDGQWSEVLRTFEVNVLRGAAPDYVRVVKVYLRYTPQVAEKNAPVKHPPRAFDLSVLSAMRLPLGQGPSLESNPALILVPHDAATGEKSEPMVVRTNNRGDGSVSFAMHLTGPFTASDSVHVDSGDSVFSSLKAIADPLAPPTWPADGRLTGELKLSSGAQELRFPLLFQEIGANGLFHFAFDFERDGSPDWVLGNGALRLFLSPRDGGRILALVSASSGENFTTTVGALRDWFIMNGETEPRDFTFNRAYSAEWIDASATATSAVAPDTNKAVDAAASDTAGVRMLYDAPEVGPAGAAIEKTVRLIAPATAEAHYRVSLNPTGGISRSNPSMQFVAVSSVPAASGEDRSTEFCWVTSDAQSSGRTEADRDSDKACNTFAPLGPALTSPEAAKGLEIRTPGHATLNFEWSAGAVLVVMKSDSALLEVAVPLAGDLPAETTLRYTVVPGR
jgi:Glycosyl hydrolases family 35